MTFLIQLPNESFATTARSAVGVVGMSGTQVEYYVFRPEIGVEMKGNGCTRIYNNNQAEYRPALYGVTGKFGINFINLIK